MFCNSDCAVKAHCLLNEYRSENEWVGYMVSVGYRRRLRLTLLAENNLNMS
jgi:hypothetical protein